MVRCMITFLFATIAVALYCTSNSIHDEATTNIASWRRLANVTSSKREEDDKSDFSLVVVIIAVSIIGSLVCASRPVQPSCAPFYATQLDLILIIAFPSPHPTENSNPSRRV